MVPWVGRAAAAGLSGTLHIAQWSRGSTWRRWRQRLILCCICICNIDFFSLSFSILESWCHELSTSCFCADSQLLICFVDMWLINGVMMMMMMMMKSPDLAWHWPFPRVFTVSCEPHPDRLWTSRGMCAGPARRVCQISPAAFRCRLARGLAGGEGHR